MESDLEGTHVSDVHRLEYAHVCRLVALAGPRVQRDAASKHRPGPFPSDLPCGSSLRPTVATTETTDTEGRKSGASQQETSPFPKRVFARLDRKRLFRATRATRAGAHLQDSRMGRHFRGRDLLPRGFAKRPRAGRCALSGGKSVAQTRPERVGALERLAPQIRQLDSQTSLESKLPPHHERGARPIVLRHLAEFERCPARFKARLPFPSPDNPKAWEVGLIGLFIPVEETPAITAKTNDSLRNFVDGLPIDTVLFYLLATLEMGKLSETLQNDVTEIKVHDVLILPQAQSEVEWMHRLIDGLCLMQSPAWKKVVGKWQEDDPDVSMREGRVGHRQQGHHARLEQVHLLFDPSDLCLTDGMGRVHRSGWLPARR